ncbi:MAG: M20 metallopeptidase family protein [Anaerovoracaceae bacterium]
MDYQELLTKHRRELHRIPELSRDLPETKKYIKNVLSELDCMVYDMLESGVCVFFDKGKEKTTAFRADMDALPVEEAAVHDYVSQHKGRMHACGHDGHMSVLLTLAQYVNDAEDLQRNVLCIFQPAEETTGGAKDICETGILEKHNVERVFGLHMWPFADAGCIESRPGALMPRSSEITVEITGKSTHATAPENGIDSLYAGACYIQDLYETHRLFKENKIAEGRTAPDEKTIIQICCMNSGTARNVIPGTCSLLGTMRAFSDEDFAMLVGMLEDTAEEISRETGSRISAMHSEGYPPVINDRRLYEDIRPVLEASGTYREMEKPIMISEDYSFYGLHVPSVFFLLGTGTGIALHSDHFDFDESVLMNGFMLFRSLI